MRKVIGCLLTAVVLAGTVAVVGVVVWYKYRQAAAPQWSNLFGETWDPAKDREAVRLDETIDRGVEAARENWRDAKLTTFSSENVYPDGRADLTLGDGGTVFLSFGSRRHSRTPDRPKGATGGGGVPCLMYHIDVQRMTTQVGDHTNCAKRLGERVPKRPECSVEQIWDRAIERGVPKDGTVARVEYRSRAEWLGPMEPEHSPGVWNLGVGEEVSLEFSDTCSLETPNVPAANLESFDPWTYVETGRRLVARNFPDANVEFEEFTAEPVREDGTVRLAGSGDAVAELRYTGRDASGTCRFWRVTAAKDGVKLYRSDDEHDGCERGRTLGPPDCSFEEIRARARDRRSDLDLAGAEVTYATPRSTPEERVDYDAEVEKVRAELRRDLNGEAGEVSTTDEAAEDEPEPPAPSQHGEWRLKPKEKEGDRIEFVDTCKP